MAQSFPVSVGSQYSCECPAGLDSRKEPGCVGGAVSWSCVVSWLNSGVPLVSVIAGNGQESGSGCFLA